ncbi:MAG: 3-oxo-tetronate kinase [Bryobacteraceae bacterium]
MIFGAIADDYTGGSDLTGMLFEQGVRVAQTFGVPSAELMARLGAGYDAITVCLKSRAIDPGDACRLSLLALERLMDASPRQIQFKYCSTFDSTERGNIGPVTDALMTRLGCSSTIAVPALPVNGRTQYLGHLFVNGVLLSESPMRHHPVNPMSDSNLVRFLARQTTRRTALVPLSAVREGVTATRAALGEGIALVDATSDADLAIIARAFADLPLITGGSGIAMHLPAVWRELGWLADQPRTPAHAKTEPSGVAVLAGSCSAATLRQLAHLRSMGVRVIEVDPARIAVDPLFEEASISIASNGVAVVASSAPPEAQTPGAAHAIEQLFGALAVRLVAVTGVRRLIVAGGETSGAVIDALAVPGVEVTGIIDPGVPALRSVGQPSMRLALKSGNFGSEDFFSKTIRLFQQS